MTQTTGNKASPTCEPGNALVQIHDNTWLSFADPLNTLATHTLDNVIPALQQAEEALANGFHVVGYMTYEAAAAFDSALVTHHLSNQPLCWFGVYREATASKPPKPEPPPRATTWQPSRQREAYRRDVAAIKHYIEQGDTYQVNHTMRLEGTEPDDAWVMFSHLLPSQPNGFCAYIDTGDMVIGSLSPELFFRRVGSHITCQPMKGTAARGMTHDDDEKILRALHHSEKDRAENIMVVDMMRNDLGRIARPGTVQVDSLFDIRKFPTLFQMTSTVSAETDAGLTDTFRALFPSASITGAPKVRTMQIIRELERHPRGVYTGAIGYAAPNGQQQFNVAIRTVVVDRKQRCATYGVGSGIVWDSDATREHEECLTKALVLREPIPPFCLLETMRWEPDRGFFFRAEHLQRVQASAAYFDIPFDVGRWDQALDRWANDARSAHRVRVTVDSDGVLQLTSHPLHEMPFNWEPLSKQAKIRARIAGEPVDTRDRFLYHKTTNRTVYDRAANAHVDADDVVLFNACEQVTETCIANLVVRQGSEWITPTVACGLLAGTFRNHLLKAGVLRERTVTLEEVSKAEQVYRINSVRGWERLALVEV